MSASGGPFPSQAQNPTSSPVLPTPRQPSPLSFSSAGNDEPPSPPTPASSFLGQGSYSSSSSYKAMQAGGSTLATPTNTHGHSFTTSPAASPSAASTSSPSLSKPEVLVPIQPLPDSLLLRSTFTALEHSTSTLKRLSKSVLTTASVVNALAEQLEKAEDDLFAALGDLGRWLENGYGISAKGSIWEPEGGIKKVNKEKRRREREEREVWVEHGLKAVKAELKRKGLAGYGAHTRFENTAKHYYNQTAVYLSPLTASTSQAGPSSYSQPLSNNGASSLGSSSSQAASAPSDMAQAVRHAQWDLARYNHHSTLLYAVPPSSIGCLDLLVGLYGWVGGLLGETPGRKDTDDSREISGLRQRASTTPPHRKLSALETPVQLLSRPSPSSPNNESLKSSLSSSLSHLARIRAELLNAWAQRDHQTALLEDILSRRQLEYGGGWVDEPSGSRFSEASGASNAMTAVSSSGVEYKKGKKMHKIHRSVGGRLRDFLNPSASSHSLAAQANPGERLSRISLDGGYGRGELSAPAPIRSKTTDESIVTTTPTLPTHPEVPTSTNETEPRVPTSANSASSTTTATPPLLPPKNTSSDPARPRLPSRHSVQMPAGADYVSPFLTSQYPPFDSSPDLRLLSAGPDRREPLPRLSMDSARPTVGGVGGLGAGGDEDERREEAGRKKEGVLWGLGSWEGLSKGGSGKGKWEKFWVVLDHSRIYEYRDNGMGMPGSAHAVIDLKFASVREGRGTDRRFVFEIVTPSQGKRLYQATSETEMKLWLYAICNAIESCINGTSSVRTFDASKLRTVSGSLDDHALPARSKLGLGFNSRAIGLGFPLPSNGRRSMPPTPTEHTLPDAASEKRTRKTSLKKVLKQSGERLSSAMGGGGGSTHRNSFGGGLDPPRPAFGKVGSRTSLPLTTPELDSIKMPPPPVPVASTPTTNPIDSSEGRSESNSSWVDGEIEKRVLEMAGLGLGIGNTDTALAPSHPSDSPNSVKRRVKSEAVRKAHHPSRAGYNASDSEPMARSKSDDRQNGQTDERDGKGGMVELRRIADLPMNTRCADCGKGMKSSRWATISTHISKPRSVDLDIWSPEMIALAREWGNDRGNEIWEATWEGGRVGDE
ncbi:hypothetical protein I317_00280 [Kwoniella heveanensis CBS 569]|nr:hypothetical protein I317_00280 [Kwoniella heveanensis CBS 569]